MFTQGMYRTLAAEVWGKSETLDPFLPRAWKGNFQAVKMFIQSSDRNGKQVGITLTFRCHLNQDLYLCLNSTEGIIMEDYKVRPLTRSTGMHVYKKCILR